MRALHFDEMRRRGEIDPDTDDMMPAGIARFEAEIEGAWHDHNGEGPLLRGGIFDEAGRFVLIDEVYGEPHHQYGVISVGVSMTDDRPDRDDLWSYVHPHPDRTRQIGRIFVCRDWRHERPGYIEWPAFLAKVVDDAEREFDARFHPDYMGAWREGWNRGTTVRPFAFNCPELYLRDERPRRRRDGSAARPGMFGYHAPANGKGPINGNGPIIVVPDPYFVPSRHAALTTFEPIA